MTKPQMARVDDGEVTETRLPDTGVLADGRTVSAYFALPTKTLKAEGWLPLVDEVPAHDYEAEYISDVAYVVADGTVTATYTLASYETE